MLFQITLVSLLHLLPFYFYNPLKSRSELWLTLYLMQKELKHVCWLKALHVLQHSADMCHYCLPYLATFLVISHTEFIKSARSKGNSPFAFRSIRWVHGPVWRIGGTWRVLLIELLSHCAWSSSGVLVLVLGVASLSLISLLHPCSFTSHIL